MEPNEGRTIEHECTAFETNDFAGHTSAAASRPYGDTLTKQRSVYQEHIRSCIKGERSCHNGLHPIARPSSLNLRDNLPTDNLRRNGPFEKPAVVSVPRQAESVCLPMQKSIRYTVSDLPMTSLCYELYQNKLRDYLYATKLHDYLYLTKLCDYLYLYKLHDYLYLTRLIENYPEEESKFNEESLKFSRRTAMKTDQGHENTNYHSIYTTVRPQILTIDGVTHHSTPKQPSRVSKYQVKGYSRSKQSSRKAIDSKVELKVSSKPQKKQIDYKKVQSEFRQRETRNEGHHSSSTNTKTFISPINSLKNNGIFETPTADFVERKIKSDAFRMEDSSGDWRQQLSDLKMNLARLRAEYPEEQFKFANEKLKFLQRKAENSNYRHFYSEARTPFAQLDAIPHHLTSQDLLGVTRSQIRKNSQSDRDSSKNVIHEVRPRTSKSLWLKQIEYKEEQLSLRLEKTVRGGEIMHPNDHYSPKLVQMPSDNDRRQHCVTFTESIVVKDSPMRISSRMHDSSKVNRLKMLEEYLEKQQLILGENQYHGFRREETRKTESNLISNGPPKVRKRLNRRNSKFQEVPKVIDQCHLRVSKHLQDSTRGAESGASSDESVRESSRHWRKTNRSRLSRRIENIWLHMGMNGKIVAIGFVIICIILSIFTKLC